MELYGKILMIASPTFLVLVLLEKLYGWYFKQEQFRAMDMLSSLSSGYTNTVKDLLKIGISLLSYEWMVNHWAVFEIKSSLLVYIIAFVALDFAGYIGHAINHKVNFFWNQHLIHHSSEEFNLACALRQSISGLINFFAIFLLPAALLGVPAQIIYFIAPIHLFAQFWYHTVHIGKLGWLEKIIVTPSHHRVHHAINPVYIDKNHGQIFIVWDKMFGTFQEELPNVPPVYGITTPVSTWNPIKINFQHLWSLALDAWRTDNFLDKFRIWFMPTGWRPADVVDKYPLEKIKNPYQFQKYSPKASIWLLTWTWVQFLTTFYFLLFLFGHIASLGTPNVFFYGAYIFLMVYAYTELMNRNPNAIYWEILKNAFGFGLIYYLGDWFGISQEYPWAVPAIMAYFVLSSIVTFVFVWFDIRSDFAPLPKMQN